MRAGLLLLAAILLIFILFFPFRVLQFIALFYIAVVGLSYLYFRLISRRLIVRRLHSVSRAQRYEKIDIGLIVENHSSLPVHYLGVIDCQNHFFFSDGGQFLISLRPGERKRLTYSIKSQDRGEYLLGPAILKGSDPLGLFPWKMRQEETERLIVYPEVLPLDLSHEMGLPAGNVRIENRVYEDPTQYRSLREYMHGDDVKRIHWKVSARMGELYSMDYLPRLYAPVLIMLNLSEDDYPLRYRYHRLERAITLAASLVMYFLDLQQDMGFVSSGSLKGEGPPVAAIRGTHGQATTILEILARIGSSRGGSEFVQVLRNSGIDVPPRTRIEVITPLLREEQRRFFRKYKEQGCQVDIFLIGSDTWGEGELRQKDLLSREFAVFPVKDYGSRLIHS